MPIRAMSTAELGAIGQYDYLNNSIIDHELPFSEVMFPPSISKKGRIGTI